MKEEILKDLNSQEKYLGNLSINDEGGSNFKAWPLKIEEACNTQFVLFEFSKF